MLAIGCLFEGKIKEHLKKHYGKYALGAGAAILGGPELAARATEHSAGEGISDEAAKLAIKVLKDKDIDPNSVEGKLALNAAKKVAKTASVESFRGSGVTSKDIDKTVDHEKTDISDNYESNKKGIDTSFDERLKHSRDMNAVKMKFAFQTEENLNKIDKEQQEEIASLEKGRIGAHVKNESEKTERHDDAEKVRSVGKKLAGGEDIREKYSIPRRIKRALEK